MKLLEIAEALDRLSNTDISGRGVISTLYPAARSKVDKPVTLAAVELLCNTIRPGDIVFIATGWVDQPLVAPGFGESDGPPGAVALARALRLALKAIPIIIVEDCLVPGVQQLAQAGGFHCVEPSVLHYSIELEKLLTLSVLPFPHTHEQAKKQAAQLINQFNPVACIAIECGGLNDKGIIHNMSGWDTGEMQAKLDYLFIEARQQGIATLAIGDGGNEIGMANIAETIYEQIPYAKQCQCPCGNGFTPSTLVDVLITANISNWGAYALAAVLAAKTGIINALNTPEKETRVLTAAAAAGFHDAIYGSVAPSADGCTLETHLAMVRLMQEVVSRRLEG